jgi:hypothetical protein
MLCIDKILIAGVDDASETAGPVDVVVGSSPSTSTNGPAGTDPFCVDPEIITSLDSMSDEELRSFSELHKDPISDVQIELYIFVYFHLATRTLSVKCIEEAVQQTEAWVTGSGPDDPDRARRSQILDMMLATMCKLVDNAKEVLPTVAHDG